MLPGGISQSFVYGNIGRLGNSMTRRSAEQRRSRHYNWGSAKLKRATKGIDRQKSQEQYQKAVKSRLKEIASEAQEVGSQVNKWLTKT